MTTPIFGGEKVPHTQATRWALDRGDGPAWFALELPPLYWQICAVEGVRPEVAFVQACHETGFGKFGRAVTPEHHNPCGLKIPDPTGLADDDPEAHFRFHAWGAGVRAHVEHLALYAGAPGYPKPYTKIDARRFRGATADPRHFDWMLNRSGDSVEGLSGKWAVPGVGYGERLAAMADELIAWQV